MSPDMLPANFAAKVRVDDDGCWIWTGALQSRGYGSIAHAGKVHSTHRLAYELLVGPIPSGLTIDHLCFHKECCNPKHLEPVSRAVNNQRRAATITECPRGHAYTEANTYIHPTHGSRECRECRAKRVRKADEARYPQMRNIA